MASRAIGKRLCPSATAPSWACPWLYQLTAQFVSWLAHEGELFRPPLLHTRFHSWGRAGFTSKAAHGTPVLEIPSHRQLVMVAQGGAPLGPRDAPPWPIGPGRRYAPAMGKGVTRRLGAN